MAVNDFLLQFQHKFSLDISDVPDFETPVFELMGAGWKSVDISGDENTDDTAYLDGAGGKTVTVMGGMPTFEFTGDYDNANTIHRFIMSKFAQYGKKRITNFKWEMPPSEGYTTGRTFSGPATIHGLDPASGDADAKSEISVSISFNGNPEITEPVPETP